MMIFLTKKTLLLTTLFFLFSNCKSDIKETTDKTSKILPNGKHLIVEKINRKTTSIGIFTNHNYGVTHSFNYKITINPDNIKWNEGSGEPKSILFCNDTVYIRYLNERTIRMDTINKKTKYSYHTEVREIHQKFIDKRYFFNLLGDSYWIDILPNTYSRLQNENSKEYSIPNDNEITIEKNSLNLLKK